MQKKYVDCNEIEKKLYDKFNHWIDECQSQQMQAMKIGTLIERGDTEGDELNCLYFCGIELQNDIWNLRDWIMDNFTANETERKEEKEKETEYTKMEFSCGTAITINS